MLAGYIRVFISRETFAKYNQLLEINTNLELDLQLAFNQKQPPMSNITQRHQTSNPYEAKFGYSRAVRKGPFIFVSGTTSIDVSSGKVLHPKSAYDQTLKIFEEIVAAIVALGGTKEDVVRLKMFVEDQKDSEGVSRALKEVFGSVAPAATMVFGMGFVNSDMRVEIEADAVTL